MNDAAAALLGFVQGELLRNTPTKIERTTPLFEDGLIDSLKILELIGFVETQLGRPIPEHEIVMKHFRTVDAIATHFFHDRADC